MPSCLKPVILSSISLFILPVAMAQSAADQKPPDHCPTIGKSTCSFTALNPACTIVINRLKPVAPPTINVRRGSVINVQIEHPSVFEQLTLDLKSASSQVPADSFQALVTALSPNLQKLTILAPFERHAGELLPKEQIQKDQSNLLNALQPNSDKVSEALRLIKPATQPPPANVCFLDDNPELPENPASPWLHLEVWRQNVLNDLNAALTLSDGTAYDKSAEAAKIALLDARIDGLTASDASPDDKAALKSHQDTLKKALAALQNWTH